MLSKGTVEGLNRSVERMFLAALPGYVCQPRPGKRPARGNDEVLLGFEVFTARLLEWVTWWNTVHQPAPLGGKTPLEAWQDDPTPLREVGAQELWTFTLEDDGRPRVLSTRGVRFRNRDYVGPSDDIHDKPALLALHDQARFTDGCATHPVPPWAQVFLRAAARYAHLTQAAHLLAGPGERPAVLRMAETAGLRPPQPPGAERAGREGAVVWDWREVREAHGY